MTRRPFDKPFVRTPLAKERARDLRRRSTGAERILWQELRGRGLSGLRFRRQQPIGPYIVDFYCSEARLVIELDGETHHGRELPDRERQAWLEREGLRVLRAGNEEVYENLEGVLEVIWEACRAARENAAMSNRPTPHPNPLPQGERE